MEVLREFKLKTDEEIYKEWPFPTRYLRKERWDIIKGYIHKHGITSVLEFGSGISTLLFNNLGLDIVSYETDSIYLRTIKSYNLANVDFRLWDNTTAYIKGYFGMSLVDGILSRTNQLIYAQKHSRYIVIDDFNDKDSVAGMLPILKNCNRLDDQSENLAIFRKVS